MVSYREKGEGANQGGAPQVCRAAVGVRPDEPQPEEGLLRPDEPEPEEGVLPDDVVVPARTACHCAHFRRRTAKRGAGRKKKDAEEN